MEHRCSKRFSQSEKILIHHNALPVAFCKMRNISVGGMFIETGPLTYRKNTPLEVEFVLNDRWFRLPVMVVNQTKEGMGLMFLEPDPVVIRDMLALLNAKKKKSVMNPLVLDFAPATT